ncbi:response regulator [Actinocatenispora thailandica]|uniref:response regulator n=1 Tax=Actinocatenispora thailandica TaxID=227318 RepID=UPI001EF33A9C|nr:response regulator [Actinocatenispora thailandica]
MDDSEQFLRAAARLLGRQGIDVVGIAQHGGEAVDRVARLRPDVALVDIDLGEESGFGVADRLSRTAGQLAVIMISGHGGADFEEVLANSPAVGFLDKSDLSADGIRRLLR